MPGFFGVWDEAWKACLRAHNIEWSAREEERKNEAAESAFYNPNNPQPEATTES